MAAKRGNGLVPLALLCQSLLLALILAMELTTSLASAAAEAASGVVHPLPSYRSEGAAGSAFPYYDARAEIARYAAVAYESYRAAGGAAHELTDAVAALLDDPSDASLAAARGAWLKVRAAYMATEVFRFYGGPIDGPGDLIDRLDPWPIDEGYVDGVDGRPDGGLIGNTRIAITRVTLRRPPEQTLSARAATGFHVIEFLLWGQDKSPGTGHGRPATDYAVGGAHHADRRRLYLTTAAKLLAEDIDALADGWAPGRQDNYAARFLALDSRDALGRMLSGLAILADQEIARRRLLAALDDRVRASGLARYSLHSNDDLIADLDGMQIVWTGDDRQSYGTGLDGLVQSLDPGLARQMAERLAAAQESLRLLPKPFDLALSAPPDSPAWIQVERSAVAFHLLARTVQDIGKLLAVNVPLNAS